MKTYISGIILSFVIFSSAYGIDMENVYINGFFSQGYLKSSDNNLYGADTEDGSWEFNEAAISIKALLDDNFTAGIQLMSRDLGPNGNNDIKVDWAFLDYRHSDEFGIRVGKFKKPEGFYNTVRDADSVRTNILLPSGIYNEQLRDIQIAVQGVGLYGFVDFEEAGSIDYITYLGNQPINTEDPVVRDSLMTDIFGISEGGDIEFKYTYGGQITWNTPIDGLRIGQSYSSALMQVNGENNRYSWFNPVINDIDLNVDHRIVSSVEYQTSRYTFAAEYMLMKVTSDHSPIGGPTTSTGSPAGGDFKLEYESYYLQLVVPINEKLKLGTYYSWYYETTQDVLDRDDPSDKLNDLAISASYSINEWWLLKAEVHFFDGWLSTKTNSIDGSDDTWNMVAVKSSISF